VVPSPSERDQREGRRNPFVPGARIFRLEHALERSVSDTGCRQRFYPLGELNDLGLFCHVEKDAASDGIRPWAVRSHPRISLYVLCLEGEGTLVLGGPSLGYAEETYRFAEGDLVIVPRDVPYRFAGAWNGIMFHARMSVYGEPAGTSRHTHPVMYWDGPSRPTEGERAALPPAGSCRLIDPLFTEFVSATAPGLPQPIPGADIGRRDAVYRATSIYDQQTRDERNATEALENPHVLGARVLRRTLDAPDVYNANAGNRQWAYPLSWSDDLAICIGATHLSASDVDRPFDSHSHPDIEEYKYIISGHGTVTIGEGDPTVEVERYEFGAGDLVVLPRGLPHVDAGDYTALYFHCRASVFGKVPGSSRYPHAAYVYTKPPRPTQEERDALNDPGAYIFMDSRETLNIYAPNPILRVEQNPTGLKRLRPDLFPEEV
jgi:mannose-6-phosphate isomerase-like protein (cupin superfamily)